MKKIALYGQYIGEGSIECVEILIKLFNEHGALLYVEKNYSDILQKVLSSDVFFETFESYEDLDSSFDIFVSIGGDGTILRAVTLVRNLNIPIIGINTGRLGFLATVQSDDIEKAFSELFSNGIIYKERSLLKVKTSVPTKEFEAMNFALNEITVSRKNTTSMITVETLLDDEYLTSYWADGLIVATPTGSTGYSLSCGGPVISPNTNSLVLTPIAPHNLSARPLVISDDTTIKLKVTGREDQHLVSLDSRIATLDNETEIVIQKADFSIRMIELSYESFFKTLRNKLLWGEDKRN